MTRKDYELTVKVLIQNYPTPEERKPFAQAFADVFVLDNPRFDRLRFMDAALEITTLRGGKK